MKAKKSTRKPKKSKAISEKEPEIKWVIQELSEFVTFISYTTVFI